MRWKLVLVFSGILILLGALTQVMLGTRPLDAREQAASGRNQARRALHTAELQWQSDALARQRWLDEAVTAASVRAVYETGTPEARSVAATAEASRLLEVAARSELAAQTPSLALFVDAQGVVIGRNDAALMRGDPLAELYPSLRRSLEAGQSGGGLWVDIQRQEQLFVTYAPVFDLAGQRSLGAVVLGVPINDEALARTSELTSGETLVALAQRGEVSTVLARYGAPLEASERSALLDAAQRAARANTALVLDETLRGQWVALRSLPDGLVLTALVGASANGGVPVGWLWAIVLLGVGMVLVAAFLFGDYVSRPISELEDGLLQIMNGDTELRFDLEHDVFGGLVSRINSMLDALTGDHGSAPPAPLEEETALDRPA